MAKFINQTVRFIYPSTEMSYYVPIYNLYEVTLHVKRISLLFLLRYNVKLKGLDRDGRGDMPDSF